METTGGAYGKAVGENMPDQTGKATGNVRPAETEEYAEAEVTFLMVKHLHMLSGLTTSDSTRRNKATASESCISSY